MYKDLSTQISASEPPHTPGVALDREDDCLRGPERLIQWLQITPEGLN